MRPRGKGQKLAWQGAWHENTKGTAQLCSLFVTWASGSEAGACWQGEHPDLGIEAMYVGGDEVRKYDYDVLLHEEDKEIQHSQPDDQ